MEGDETEFLAQEAPIALRRLSPRILLSSALTLLPTGCVCVCVCVCVCFRQLLQEGQLIHSKEGALIAKLHLPWNPFSTPLL